MGSLTYLDILFAIFTVVLLKKVFTGTKRSIPLPPGPSKLPLLDNLLDLPTDKAWVTFSDWGKKWGDIVSISALGQHIVILNSARVALEMLDKKSAIYSDRPVLQMGGELVGWNNSLGLLPYGDRFRNYRKFFHQLMGNRTAVHWAETLTKMVEAPHQFVKQQMASGTAESSFTSRLLEGSHITAEQERDIKWSALSIYGGGADTASFSFSCANPITVSTIYAFFSAMTVYPDVARKAQAEIDAVVGTDRLPTFSDRENLPYTNAVALEIMRWHVVAPTGLPHCVTEDNIHDGYLIPKGAVIFANIWSMLHDPKVYSNPASFNPERFLGPNMERDPRDICFGFGRRICPGRVLADSSVFIACAMVLSVFDITKYSKDGIVIEPVVGQMAGTISHPEPFKCSILPRSQKALDLINSDFES
ncbi:cytochrome P450 [Phlegmacium glaucopus]|nr:cytochrome P450 [Phlegmacium glaucopus]